MTFRDLYKRTVKVSWTSQASGLSFIKEVWRRNDGQGGRSSRRYRCGPLVELGDILDVSGYMSLVRGIKDHREIY